MKLTTPSLTGLTLIVLSLLLLTPAHASPALGLENTAAYAVTASVKTVQSCSATANAGYACGISTLPPNSTVTINILDNGTCSLNSTSTACRFDPATLYTTAGYTVRWVNTGTLLHLLTSNSSGFYVSYYMYPGYTDYYTFQNPGTYNYYDANHPWMKGQIQVAPAPPPTPAPPTTMQFDVSGPVSWKVVGLDSSTAVLSVSHQLSLTVNIVGLSISPVSETGSFEQSINLSTREESAGTATALIKAVLEEYATALSRASYYGYYSQLSSLNIPDTPMYTIWWVNGPLKNGSPVEILNGYSSVFGSETVSLGGTTGNRDAWKVGSSFTQTVRVTTPQPVFGTTLPPPPPPPPVISTNSADFALSLQFDYDKVNDLLLHSNSTINIVQTTQTLYQPGQSLCTSGYPYTCIQLTAMTTVTHQTTANVSVQMQLTSTDLPFNHGAAPTSQSQGPTTPPSNSAGPSSTSTGISPLLLYGSISTIALGAIGVTLWIILRNPLRRGKPSDALPSLPVN